MARSDKNTIKVVKKFSENKKETFEDILFGGQKEDILEFLRTKNLLNYEKGFSFEKILYLLKDKAFYN